MPSASAQVLGSGTVGPLPMTSGASPGTSLISSVTTRAGAQAASSRPPLMADRCLRTQFISWMAAPLFSRALLMARLSSRPRPGAGSDSKAEAPPPWTIPGLQAVTKPHVVVIGQAKNAGVNARLASRAEAAAVDARSLWKVPGWNGRAVLVATTDTGYLDTWFGTGKAGPGQPSADRFNAYVTTPGDGTSTATGFRTVLGTDFLLRDNRATRSDLRYMFTILAMQSSSDDLLPAWLYYGSADYTAWRAQGRTDPLETLRARGLADGTWSALRRRTWRPQLTDSQSTFAEGSKAKIANDWDSAFFTVAYIVDTYGEKTLTGLLVDIGSGTATDAALRTRLHLTQDQLTAKVRAYARPLAARA